MNAEISKLSDPTVVGPGIWWLIHMKAKDATNDELVEEFIDYIYFLAEKFSCKKCRKHINQYIETHPFDDLRNLRNDEGERIGMFKWSWLFHNAVNTRIGKPYVEWETAVEMFYGDSGICSQNCEETEEDPQEVQTPQNTDIDMPQDLPINDLTDRKSRLAQAYFMSIGIPKTLQKNGVYSSDNRSVPKEESWVSFASVGN